MTPANPRGFTPGSTQTSVNDLGTKIGGVAQTLGTIDTEVTTILADQLIVLEALGLAEGTAAQVGSTAIDLQLRAKDVRANVGTAADAAIEANRDTECQAPTSPPGVPDPVPAAEPCNTANGLANTIDARLDTIQGDTADFQALSVRASIERAIADPSQPLIAVYALPAANGGYLETVRDLVTDTITNLSAAGQSVGNGPASLAAANAAFAAGQYADAYTKFATAYRDAAK